MTAAIVIIRRGYTRDHQSRHERKQSDEEQHEQIETVGNGISSLHEVGQTGMGDPDAADESKAYKVPEKVRPELLEGLRKGDRKGRDSQLEYENRDRYGEDPVGKGVEPVEGKNGCTALRSVVPVMRLIAHVVHDSIFLV